MILINPFFVIFRLLLSDGNSSIVTMISEKIEAKMVSF